MLEIDWTTKYSDIVWGVLIYDLLEVRNSFYLPLASTSLPFTFLIFFIAPVALVLYLCLHIFLSFDVLLVLTPFRNLYFRWERMGMSVEKLVAHSPCCLVTVSPNNNNKTCYCILHWWSRLQSINQSAGIVTVDCYTRKMPGKGESRVLSWRVCNVNSRNKKSLPSFQ